MTDLQAANCHRAIKRIQEIISRRQKIAGQYQELKDIKGIILPKVSENRTHVYHQYTLRITKDYRLSWDEMKKYLEEKRNPIEYLLSNTLI